MKKENRKRVKIGRHSHAEEGEEKLIRNGELPSFPSFSHFAFNPHLLAGFCGVPSLIK